MLLHTWHADFCKRLIADSYLFSVVPSEQVSDLITHHQRPDGQWRQKTLWVRGW